MRRTTPDRKKLGGIAAAVLLVAGAAWAVRDTSYGETDRALSRVAKLEAKQDVPALTAAAHSGTPAESVRAVTGLSTVFNSRAATPTRAAAREAIRRALTDARPEVRAAAARAWASVGSPADVVELRAALTADASSDVRRAAANALGELMAWDGMNDLAGAMDDPDRLVRHAASTAVLRVTGAKFQYDPDDGPERRQAAITTIRRLMPSLKPAHDDYVRRLGRG